MIAIDPCRSISRILVPEVTFISLQKDVRAEDATALAGRSDIVDLTAHLADFAETAALINCLDLVITVDTSVAHLAAALGRPTWILLPFVPDYRWLLDRDDSPWYPTARLFRQERQGDYADVVERVKAELASWASAYVGSARLGSVFRVTQVKSSRDTGFVSRLRLVMWSVNVILSVWLV